MENKTRLLSSIERIRSSLLYFFLGMVIIYVGIALFPAGLGFFKLGLVKLGLALFSALLILLGGVVLLFSVLTYKKGFDELANVEPRKYGIGATGALIVLISIILIIIIITAPIGIFLLWLGILLTGIALIRLGEQNNSTLTVISSILFMIPFLNWLGAILLYFALGEVMLAIKKSLESSQSTS